MQNKSTEHAETIKNIWNYNNFDIRGIPNGELQHDLFQDVQQRIYSFRRYFCDLPKYYILFNLLNLYNADQTNRESRDQQRELELELTQIRREQPQRRRAHVMYLLFKLTQLWLVIVLLLPFLITHKALIQHTNAQDVIDPFSLLIASSNSNGSTFQINHSKHIDILNSKDIDSKSIHQPNQTLKTIRRNLPNFNELYNNHSKGNEYSLIVLSQSSNHFYAGVADSIDSKAIFKTDAAGAKSNQTKRYINDKNSVTSIHKIINRKEADIQMLKPKFDEYKQNHKMYKNKKLNNLEKLASLIMNGLRLKKLPDMKKANISQIEYSRKYIEYLERLRKNNLLNSDDGNMEDNAATSLQLFSIVTNKFKDITRRRRHHHKKRATRSTDLLKNAHKRSRSLNESDKTNILLHFPLMINEAQFKYEQISEANVRLMILYSPALAEQSRPVEAVGLRAFRRKQNNRFPQKPAQNEQDCKNEHINNYLNSKSSIKKLNKRKKPVLNLKVYQLLRLNKRQMLDARQIEFDNDNSNYSGVRNDETFSQWLEFDVTAAVRSWLNKTRENLGIEIQCDKCKRIGARILSDVSTLAPNVVDKSTSRLIHDRFHLTPVLNIIGHIGRTYSEEPIHSQTPNFKWNNQSYDDYFYHRYPHGQSVTKKLPNSCYRARQRCCRHQLDVDFKNIKGFEFIIQPKTFDAGYCKGRCPPRHNPAHHHALLQSLIWQQDHNRVPRPCCVPSKLAEIEILHVDEEHSDKLKISTWNNMQVLECACS